MLIDVSSVSRFLGASVQIDDALTLSDLSEGTADQVVFRSISFKGQLVHEGHGLFLLTGRLKATAQAECARCLIPVDFELDVPVDAVYRSGKVSAEAAPQMDEDESYGYAGHRIDLDQAIRDNLLLGLPQRILCKEDCPGLCPVCGNNLNERNCGCTTSAAGPVSPFDSLKQLLQDDENVLRT